MKAKPLTINGVEINLSTILSISANKREELRACDVDRVMSLAEEIGVRNEFRAWLLASKSFAFGTREEIEAWQPEVSA